MSFRIATHVLMPPSTIIVTAWPVDKYKFRSTEYYKLDLTIIIFTSITNKIGTLHLFWIFSRSGKVDMLLF